MKRSRKKGAEPLKITNELYDIIEETKKDKTKAYDTPAQVTRTEGSTLWVHIPGGVQETPIKKTVNASPGDTVQVRVSGGTAWVVGNASAPPTDDTTALKAEADATSAAAAAGSALRSATTAREAADEAETQASAASAAAVLAEGKADAASAAADRADDKADDAADAAESAQASASGALDSLSTVQDVLGVLEWAQDNATFTPTADTEVEPGKTYWTYNSTTQKYEPVANPSPAALSTYYEISGVDEAMAAFINAHLALTNEGLWILGGLFDVLIATGGAGHTYQSAGTYIIGPTGPVAYFGSNGIELKGRNFSNVLETYCKIRKDDTFLKAVKYVPTQPGMDILKYTQTTQITEDGFVIKRERGSGTAVTAFEVTPSDPDGTSAGDDALLLLQATRDDLQRYPDGGSVRLSTSDGEGVVLGYWLNGNFTETARMDNTGGITVTGDIWADGNIEADGNINCNGNMSPAGDLLAGGSVEDGNGNVLADKADASSIPTKTSDLTNDGDGTDPFATTAEIPTATSELTNDGDGTSPFATLDDIPTGGGSTFYGSNSQSGTATLRTVDVADTSFALERGVIVAVKFMNGVPSAATLNVNSTGAKAIYYEGATIVLGTVKAGDLVTFQYDGSYWNVLAIDRQPTKTSELTNDGDGTDPFATTADLASKINGSTSGQSITLGSWKLCWGSYTTNTSSASGSGTFAAPYYVNENISLSFRATPYVWAQVQGSLTGSNYALVTATSTTGATIRLMSSHKNTTTRTIRWFAIGQA